MIFIYVTFVILILLCALIHFFVIKERKSPVVGSNPIYRSFLRKYCVAYVPALFADWLQGPYLYKLYSHYGFQEDQIAVLYVCGFASNFLLGTIAQHNANRFGRKKLCILFTIIYSVACFMKLSANYGVLVAGRILGGVATALLSSSFEAWYVQEHIDRHDFPKDWIPATFSMMDILNGALAIAAGIVANLFAEWLHFGPVSPFMLAIPCLLVSLVTVVIYWDENYSKSSPKFSKMCSDGLKNTVSDQSIFLIGTVQSFFESVMYIFIFIWTPILDDGHTTLGIVFSSFMLCIMIGSGLFHLLKARRVPMINLLAMAVILALLANIICVIAIHPDNMNHSLSFVAFLVIELAVGLYFPAMGHVRQKIIPENMRAGVLNWFRIPLNLIACVVLMLLHNQSFHHGNRLIFVACTGLLSVASLSVVRLIALEKEGRDSGSESESEEESLIS